MPEMIDIITPGPASQWYDLGVSFRKSARFGEAINAFQKAADLAVEELSRGDSLPRADREAAETLLSRSIASIELIREINGFVNTDLMNP